MAFPKMEIAPSIIPPTKPSTAPQASSPIFTEINIPLPALPVTPPPKHGYRALSFSALPFHRHASSSPHVSHHFHNHSTEIVDEKQAKIALKSAMNEQVPRARTQTLGALAVAPALLILSTELFTPGRTG